MILEFTSTIKRDEMKDEIIKFSVPVSLGNRDGYKTWEFQEPSQKIMNLIEANMESVNIFTGSQTIELKYKDKITNNYQQEGMPSPVIFDSFLNEITINDYDLEIEYSLWQNKQIIGNYHMNLNIKK